MNTLLEKIEAGYDETPIVMIDVSGSTGRYMNGSYGGYGSTRRDKPRKKVVRKCIPHPNLKKKAKSYIDSDSDSEEEVDDSVNDRVLDREFRVIKSHLLERGIKQARFVLWDNATEHYKNGKLLDIAKLSSRPVNSRGGTSIGQALVKIPEEWYCEKEYTDLYIVTDGEISDGTQCKEPFRNLINKNCRINIITVEGGAEDYMTNNCNAGGRIYQTLNDLKLMKHVKRFTCFNNKYKEGFVALHNPEVPIGYAPFGDKCFRMDQTAKFVAYLDNLVEQTPKENLMKLAHEVSLTLYYLIKDKAMCVQRGIINMFCHVFSDTDLYSEIRDIFLKETDNHSHGKATTFQAYRNNREKVFEAAQMSLYDDVNASVSNGHYDKVVSLVTKSDQGDIVVNAPANSMTEPIHLSDKEYKFAGLRMGNYSVPLVPNSIVMDHDKYDQCVRQWLRANYSKKYNINAASDMLLYYYLTDALRVHLSDVSESIKKAYRGLTRLMLDRKRFGTDMTEYDYLMDGNPPAPVTGNADKIDYMLNKCVTHAGTEGVNPFTLWFGIIKTLGEGPLVDSQLKFCEDGLKEDGVNNNTVMEFLTNKISLVKEYEIPGEDTTYEYNCYITLEDTSETGGYSIAGHKLSKHVTCTPRYVITEDTYDIFTEMADIKCPLCYSKLELESFTKVKSKHEIEEDYAKSKLNMSIPVIQEPYYDTTKCEEVKVSEEMYSKEDMAKPDPVKKMDEYSFDTISYKFKTPIVQEALSTKQMELKTQEEFNTAVKSRYPFLSKLKMENACLAGGFCRSIILRQKLKDLDFFFYGEDHYGSFVNLLEETLKSIKEHKPDIKFLMMYKPLFNVYEVVCVTDPAEFLKGEYSLDNFKQYDFKSLHRYDKHTIIDPETGKVYRKKGKYEAKVEDDTAMKDIENRDFANYFEDGDVTGIRMVYRLQFILAKYNKIEDVLQNFDIYPSRVAYDGKDTYFTDKSAYAYKYMINVVNEHNYSTLFSHRLSKYFTYGFSPVFPELDLERVNKMKYLKFQELTFKTSRIDGNVVMVGHNSHIEDKLKSLEALERKAVKKEKVLYKSSLFCSLVSILRYVKINDISYKFTSDILLPSAEGKIMFREKEETVHFIDEIMSRIEDFDFYRRFRLDYDEDEVHAIEKKEYDEKQKEMKIKKAEMDAAIAKNKAKKCELQKNDRRDLDSSDESDSDSDTDNDSSDESDSDSDTDNDSSDESDSDSDVFNNVKKFNKLHGKIQSDSKDACARYAYDNAADSDNDTDNDSDKEVQVHSNVNKKTDGGSSTGKESPPISAHNFDLKYGVRHMKFEH